jgi:hypothetical protein
MTFFTSNINSIYGSLWLKIMMYKPHQSRLSKWILENTKIDHGFTQLPSKWTQLYHGETGTSGDDKGDADIPRFPEAGWWR